MKKFLLHGLVFLLGGALAWGSGLDRARALYERAEYRQAIELLRNSPEGRTPEGLWIAGRAWYQLGDYRKAVEALEKLAEARPNDADVWLWLGRAWGRRAETSNVLVAPSYASKSRQCFEKAVQLNPRNAEALNDLFSYYLEAPGFLGGGMEKAEALIERIRALDPAEAEYALAQLAEKRRHYDSAEAHLRRAIELAPRQVGRLVDLARFLVRRGRMQEAEKTFEQAEAIAPESPKVLFAKAESYLKAGRKTEARRLLEQYLKAPITPDDPPREEALKLLERIGS
ncbi:MAG: tetratricopeptide repeat protein [Bryobacteraceae bacterium]|nr:tetratricopeptide repeat protein [Bryobacteraceae bacterium]MCX7605073.1 tetratricopeptide repeat protein [Bryobacteraceae bacterium]